MIDPVELGVWYLVAGLAVPAATWWLARAMARRHDRGSASELAGVQSDLDELVDRVDTLAVQAAQREDHLARRVRALIAVAEDSARLRLAPSGGSENGHPGNMAR